MSDLRQCAAVSLAMTLIWASTHDKLPIVGNDPSTSVLAYSFFYYFAIIYALLKFYRIFIYPYYISPLRDIPGPTNNQFLIGQFKHIVSAFSPNSLFLAWSARWPDEPFIRYLGPLNKEILLVNTPEAHKEVLMTNWDSFRKPSLFRHLVEDITGPGSLLFAEGNASRRYRKILSEPFSVPKLKVVFSVFQEKAELLAQYFASHLDENGEGIFDSEDTPDYWRVSMRRWALTLLVSRCLFLPIDTSYLHAIARIRGGVTECVHDRMKAIEETEARGEKFSTSMLPNGGRDLLTLIIEERQNFKGSSDELSVSEMVDQLVTFLPAGHETIAGAMTWASYILATNTAVQTKLRTEILSLLSTLPPGTPPSWNDIDRLTYLNNFAKEIVRLYPTATLSYREAKSDITICGRFLPKNTPLLFVWAVASQSKATWGPDADQVVPERWERLSGKAADPYAWQSFASGPRVCIGKNYAMMEMKAFLMAIVPKFRFVKSEEIEKLGGRHPPYITPALTLWPKGPMMVGLQRI
ncbi:cytochrome P450 [Cercophora newfieldiana]|uniref:Cytochrome P450 n=1 Tax=Cercophora newfieldiana TaxID=92897 RepID=A0AA40CKG9_9PEZI|nr:cytochrome P450 [Cercophora newfieldiana]